MKHDHVNIAVGDAQRPGVEKVPARRVAEHEWKLVRSPLYSMGVAAGDVIRILDATTGAYVGFTAIEEAVGAAVGRHPEAQWQYSNVYDPVTGEPIGWWRESGNK